MIIKIRRLAGVRNNSAGHLVATEASSAWRLSPFVLVVMCMYVAPIRVSAQDKNDPTKPDRVLFASDDWPIHVTYFESVKGKEAPVVVLLTAANGNQKSGPTRRVWTELATHLQKSGFAVLSVDLRKHGDSQLDDGVGKTQNKVLTVDYRNMVVGDMEAVKAFLLEMHHNEKLNIRKMAIVSSGSSCLVGAAFALNDWNRLPYRDAPTLAAGTPRGQDVRAIVMLSPLNTRGFDVAKILRPLRDPNWRIAFRIYHSSEDKAEQKFAKKVLGLVNLKGEKFDGLRSIEAAPASGEGFLEGRTGKALQDDLTRFLKTYVLELASPWKSRKSPLED